MKIYNITYSKGSNNNNNRLALVRKKKLFNIAKRLFHFFDNNLLAFIHNRDESSRSKIKLYFYMIYIYSCSYTDCTYISSFIITGYIT